jgi:hypothetical protein
MDTFFVYSILSLPETVGPGLNDLGDMPSLNNNIRPNTRAEGEETGLPVNYDKGLKATGWCVIV